MFIPDLVFHPTWKTRHLKAFKNLNGIWLTPNDEIYRVPFVEDELDILILRKEFFLKEKPQDTLFLYFEGVSWETEIYLNGKLLGIYEKPFEEILISIPPSLFTIQWNWIEVKLKKYSNQTDEWWTVPLLGIHKSVFLLQKDVEKKVIQNAYYQSDTLLIYFPFSSSSKYNISEEEFLRDMEVIKSFGVKVIYIPYYIPRRLKNLLNEVHMTLHPNYKQAKYVAIYKSFSETNEYPFWLKENNEKSSFFGNFVRINSTQLFRTVSELSKPLIVMWIFIVLVLLLVYRISNFEAYKKLWNIIQNVRQTQILANDFQLLSSFSLKYIFVVRIFMKSLLISLFINYLHSTDNLRYLNFWHKNNTIYNFSKEYGASMIWTLVFVLMILGIINFVKLMIWQLVEWVYHLKDYRNKNLVIEVYGEMPFLFYSFLGMVSLMLVGGYLGLLLLIVGYLLMVFKKQYFLFSVYNFNYKIPLSAIFFYFCAFELLPWLLLI